MAKITQIVLYTLNANNPKAETEFVKKAKELLVNIPGVQLTVGRARPSDRTVAISNGLHMKMTTFDSKEAMENYFAHPNLRKWCQFVLCGWMLEGSKSKDPESEFINHILSGAQDHKWARNPKIPESEVVWAGEKIVIFDHL